MILIGLGGNLESPRWGSPRRTLEAALAALAAGGVAVAMRSGWYYSEPVPRADQPWYVNAVAALATRLPPLDLLDLLQAVEARFGRVRSIANAPRPIDLDLLDHNGQILRTPRLVLPHPRLHERRFVLAPLAEIAPLWRHPVLGLGAAELLSRLGDEQPVYRLSC